MQAEVAQAQGWTAELEALCERTLRRIQCLDRAAGLQPADKARMIRLLIQLDIYRMINGIMRR